MQKSFVCTAAALLLTIFCPASKANLITNGNFALTNNSYSQTAAPEGWSNIGPADGVIADSVFGTPSYGGSSYYFDTGGFGDSGPNSGDGIEQAVATAAGTTYTLTFGLSNENDSSGGPEYLTILVNGTAIQSIAVSHNSSYQIFQLPWTAETLNFTAASASSTIAFTVTGTGLGDQDPLIAGVDLETSTASPAPEPSSLWFAGLTLLALAGFRARRSSQLHSANSK